MIIIIVFSGIPHFHIGQQWYKWEHESGVGFQHAANAHSMNLAVPRPWFTTNLSPRPAFVFHFKLISKWTVLQRRAVWRRVVWRFRQQCMVWTYNCRGCSMGSPQGTLCPPCLICTETPLSCSQCMFLSLQCSGSICIIHWNGRRSSDSKTGVMRGGGQVQRNQGSNNAAPLPHLGTYRHTQPSRLLHTPD